MEAYGLDSTGSEQISVTGSYERRNKLSGHVIFWEVSISRSSTAFSRRVLSMQLIGLMYICVCIYIYTHIYPSAEI